MLTPGIARAYAEDVTALAGHDAVQTRARRQEGSEWQGRAGRIGDRHFHLFGKADEFGDERW